MTQQIEINLDRLYLEGVLPMHELRIRAAIQHHLAQLLARPEAVAALRQQGATTLDTISLTRRPGALPEDAAAQVAQSVYRQLIQKHDRREP